MNPVDPAAQVLDPDRDRARQLLTDELARPDYHRPRSWVERAWEWVLERAAGLLDVLPGSGELSWLLLLLVLVLGGLAAWFAVRGRRRVARWREPARGAVLEDPALGAEDYRARAEQARLAGDWDGVLLDSYRAVAADAVRRTLVDPAPGQTAREVAAALGPAFPEHERALHQAATAFDAVRYGSEPAGAERAATVLELDRTLAGSQPDPVGTR